MFTYAYWCSEVQVFQGIFHRSDYQEQTYVLALSALTNMAAHLVQDDPSHKAEVSSQFQECWDLAKRTKGRTWVLDHTKIIAIHGSIPPQ